MSRHKRFAQCRVQRRVDPVLHDVITLGDKARAPVVDVYGVGVRTTALARALNSIRVGKTDRAPS